MALTPPPAVLEAFGEPACRTGDVPWYAQELSIDELESTVAVINAALRASRT